MRFAEKNTKSERIYSIYSFYLLLSIVISIFIIQFLIIDSYGINNNPSAKNNKVIDTIYLDASPQCIEYNPQNGNMYVTSYASIYVINTTNNITDIISLDASPQCIEYNPQNGNMYVTSNNGLYSIDNTTNNITKLLSLETDLGFITYNKNENNFYIHNGFFDQGNVIIIDGSNNKINANISTVSYLPGFLEYNPVNDFVYMQGMRNGIMAMMKMSNDSDEPIVQGLDNFPLVKDMFYNENDGYLYFTTSVIGNEGVLVVDPNDNRIIKSIPLNGSEAVGFNPNNNFLYITNSDPSMKSYVSVFDTSKNNTLIKNIPIGSGPNALTFNVHNDYMYIVNTNDNSISVLS